MVSIENFGIGLNYFEFLLSPMEIDGREYEARSI